MAQIVRLTTHQQRSEREEAAQVAEQLSLLSDEFLKHLPGEARLAISRATHALQKAARPDTTEGLWPGGFTMLSRNQTIAIWDAIRALPSDDRPHQVRHDHLLNKKNRMHLGVNRLASKSKILLQA
ncbi:hypothetical protein [Acetobacter pasteurianus]|uniref:hypothetical protein n=1 Tax=Acetobacter pasteurianus TaxID=438 RepID=UPI000414AD01|nr:hypothetical protein [Acetobacter pasteurianus]